MYCSVTAISLDFVKGKRSLIFLDLLLTHDGVSSICFKTWPPFFTLLIGIVLFVTLLVDLNANYWMIWTYIKSYLKSPEWFSEGEMFKIYHGKNIVALRRPKKTFSDPLCSISLCLFLALQEEKKVWLVLIFNMAQKYVRGYWEGFYGITDFNTRLTSVLVHCLTLTCPLLLLM